MDRVCEDGMVMSGLGGIAAVYPYQAIWRCSVQATTAFFRKNFIPHLYGRGAKPLLRV